MLLLAIATLKDFLDGTSLEEIWSNIMESIIYLSMIQEIKLLALFLLVAFALFLIVPFLRSPQFEVENSNISSEAVNFGLLQDCDIKNFPVCDLSNESNFSSETNIFPASQYRYRCLYDLQATNDMKLNFPDAKDMETTKTLSSPIKRMTRSRSRKTISPITTACPYQLRSKSERMPSP